MKCGIVFVLVVIVAALILAATAYAQGPGLAVLTYDGPPLTMTCGGGGCIPDYSEDCWLYWDQNANGPDPSDALAIVAPSGSGRVNWNHQPINGEESGYLCGQFYFSDPALIVRGGPAGYTYYYYFKLFLDCPDDPDTSHHIIWTSTVFEVHAGSQEVYIAGFTCDDSQCSITVQSPNGGEEWRIGESSSVIWQGYQAGGSVRIELNRDYPYGAWEVLADSTANDGVDNITVTGPPSERCRVRISRLSGTTSDESDADFRIVSHFRLTSPNGGEHWPVFHPNTVTWVGDGFDSVRIELNRDYPSGEWEPFAASTPNDGSETVFTTDPLSEHCRIRISAIGDTLWDISDGDFVIEASEGYLALVRPSAPTVPVLAWNAGEIECGQGASQSWRLKNFGSEAIVVFQPLEPATSEFSRATTCGLFFALVPGQMSACSLTLTFASGADGSFHDTLLIQTDAVNQQGGYVRIPVSGVQIRTPATPQVVITPQGQDAVLRWDPVTQSIGGCPIIVSGYLVFYSPVTDGPYYYHGFTADTSYTHVRVLQFAPGMFYQVVTYTGPLAAVTGLTEGMKEEEVRRKLR